MSALTVQQAFELALQHHQAGRLADAEALYRQILAVQPQHADALHFLGVIAGQVGQHAHAIDLICQAIAIRPDNAGAHSNLGGAYRAMGRWDEAISCYHRALQLQPGLPETHNNLGNALRDKGRLYEAITAYRSALELKPDMPETQNNLGRVLLEVGRLDDAIIAYRRAVELKPNYAEAHNHLGIALRDRGRPDEALSAFQRAIQIKADYAEAHNNLGNVFRDGGQFDEAIAAYRGALNCHPQLLEAQCNLGSVLKEQGHLDDAVAAYRRALQIAPDHAIVHYNLGIALADQGKWDEAIAAFRRALELKPDFAEAESNLGNALTNRGLPDQAIEACLRAIRLAPELAAAYNNLGNALSTVERIDQAIVAFRRAIELKPDYGEASNNLGVAYRDGGRLDEAMAVLRQALEHQPGSWEAHNNLGNVFKDQGNLPAAIAEYRQALSLDPDRAEVWSNLIYACLFLPGSDETTMRQEFRRWNGQFGGSAARACLPQANARHPDRRLRIGYVSPDLRDHVIGRNLRPLFHHHNRQDFHLICYSGVAKPDELTEEFRRHSDQWRSIVGVGDEMLCDMIRQDEVDILVDLTQHLANNRLVAFTHRPAPIQVSFAGYPESAGVEAIGNRLSDPYLVANESGDSDGGKGFAVEMAGKSEQVYFLDSFWCYDPCGLDVAINALPAQESGRIAFGCLNNFCKLNEPVLKLWARVLEQTKGSTLTILADAGSHQQRVLQILEREGIEAQRVEFVSTRPRRQYLGLYHRLDIVLDTFPYGGHTTSLDALWMGVPVVSLAGQCAVSRAGLSQLTNLGLPELVAFTDEDYVRIVTRLAADLPRLAELRRTLRQRMESSVLMDARRFASQIENAYRAMWRQWCAQEAGK